MPPAAGAAIPAVIGGISLLDQLFGSGKNARDMQQQGLDLQQQLANAQLPDIQRRSELNQTLQDILMGMFENPELPSQYFDLDSTLSKFIGGAPIGQGSDFYNAIGPGIMANSALSKLMGLGGDVGTGGIQGFANMSNQLGESRRGEFQDTVQGLVETLLMRPVPGAAPTTPARYYPNTGTQVFDAFNQIPTFTGR